jgi:uncharacterized protein YjeT (DUF2065 family)
LDNRPRYSWLRSHGRSSDRIKDANHEVEVFNNKEKNAAADWGIFLLGVTERMNQIIGAYLDCLLLILLGTFFIIGAPRLIKKTQDQQLTGKGIKRLRLCGWIILAAGVGLFAIRLFSEN